MPTCLQNWRKEQTMPSALITFTFLSPWHMGSGFGEGANLDALPVKTAAGLPYIPGRSIKGLFREAVQLAEECGQLPTQTTTTDLFGSNDSTLSRYETTAGRLQFSNATMGEAMERWAAEQSNRQAARELYMPLASTAIDANGLADDNSLRKIEVALPVTLSATVSTNGTAADDLALLRKVAPLIRQAGSDRHRGLGRVQVAVTEVNQ